MQKIVGKRRSTPFIPSLRKQRQVSFATNELQKCNPVSKNSAGRFYSPNK